MADSIILMNKREQENRNSKENEKTSLSQEKKSFYKV